MGFKRIGVIMAGGSGERFWPVSRPQRPKQFLRLGTPEKSLLQEAVSRAEGLFGTEYTYIATGEPWARLSREECPELEPNHVLVEPAKRNTTGCLVWAVATVMARDDNWSNVSMAVLTADHRITPTAGFHDSVTTALETAESTGGLVTIGITPDRPETGYGYVELGEQSGEAFIVDSFKEKPDIERAQEYFSSGNHLWNSGMFFWTLPAFLAELQAANPEAAETTRELAGLIKAGEAERAKSLFEQLESISIDFALMEKAKRVLVVKATFDWDDLGSWDALRRTYLQDGHGNVALGGFRAIETRDAVVYNEVEGQEVCLLGVEGLVVVVTKDKVMVCPVDRTQDVRKFSKS